MIVDVAGAAAALQAADDILILTHRRPDGDTAGCAGALCRGLQQIGKRAYILENPEITRRYAPLIVPYYPPEDFVPAYVVSTDIAEEKLFPDTAEPYKGKVDLVIDHHGSNDGFGKKNLIRPDAGGCAEVLYDVRRRSVLSSQPILQSAFISVFRPIRAALSSRIRPRIRMR